MLDSLQLPGNDRADMVWFYERHGTYIRCETREVVDGFELVIIRPDGTESVEGFDDSAKLSRRQQEIESTFTVEGWAGPFGRTI